MIITQSGGNTTVTTPDGVVVQSTDTGGGTYAAPMPDGSVVAGNADGTTKITAPDGSTTNYDRGGHATSSAPPDLRDGAGVDGPPLTHDVKTPTEDGGYNISHPDGSVDLHRPDGTVVHVEADGLTWHPLP